MEEKLTRLEVGSGVGSEEAAFASSLPRSVAGGVPVSLPLPLSFLAPLTGGGWAEGSWTVIEESERDRNIASSPAPEPEATGSEAMVCRSIPAESSVLGEGSRGAAVALWFLADARCARPDALLAGSFIAVTRGGNGTDGCVATENSRGMQFW